MCSPLLQLPLLHWSHFHRQLRQPLRIQVSKLGVMSQSKAKQTLALILLHAPASCACCCAGSSLAPPGAAPRTDSDGQLACEQCGKRLSRCKRPLHRHVPGHVCDPCFKVLKRTAAAPPSDAAPAAPKQSRKRRAESDPGEPLGARSPSPPRVRPSTYRVTPPTPIAAQKKQRTTRQDDRIMRLLDETHARRMAAQQKQ